MRITCCSIIIHVIIFATFFKLSIHNSNKYRPNRDVVLLSRSIRKPDILAQFNVRKQDNDG